MIPSGALSLALESMPKLLSYITQGKLGCILHGIVTNMEYDSLLFPSPSTLISLQVDESVKESATSKPKYVI